MARLGAVRSHHCALLLAAALAVCAFYYLGSGRETFSSATKRLKEARAGAPAAPSPPVPPEQARGSVAPALGAKAKSLDGGGAGPVDYHLLMMFTKAEHNAALQAKARVALRSLLRLAKFEAHEVLNLHFVSEEASREVAKALLRELLPPAAGFKCKVSGAAAEGSRRLAHRVPRAAGVRASQIPGGVRGVRCPPPAPVEAYLLTTTAPAPPHPHTPLRNGLSLRIESIVREPHALSWCGSGAAVLTALTRSPSPPH